MSDEFHDAIAVVREWQQARRAFLEAQRLWCNEPIEDEKALWDRLASAEDALMEVKT